MKVFTLVVALALMVGPMAFATITDALEISSGGLVAEITDNGACVNIAGTPCTGITGDTDLTAGTDTINGSINGWSLHVVSGTSHSPGLTPFGLYLTSLTASCSVLGGCMGGN
jgi:hypothetical protein